MAGKLTLAAYSAAGCGGCEIALLEIHEHVLELAEAADIVFWPAIADFKYADIEAMPDGFIDVCLFNGAIRTEENAHAAELLRRKSKALVAFGACASFGGVPGLGNLFDTADVLERAFTTESTDVTDVRPRTTAPGEESCVPALTDRVSALSGVASVDYVVPGCAPEAPQVWGVCQAVIAGQLPTDATTVGAGDRSVCDECPREKRNVRVRAFVRPHQIVPEPEWCLLEQGVVCMGPATRSGCVARCPSAAMPCRGCYGPAGDAVDQGAKMASALGTIVDSEDEQTIVEIMEGVADPAGTFYCFSLPTSLMGGARPSKAAGR
jgi:F420-non-reducing hydrogenase small subunit